MSENPATVDGSSGGTGATSDGAGDTGGLGEESGGTGGPAEGSGDTGGPGEVIVEATGLTKQFDSGDPVIEDVDLTIHEGETTILVGPNGAGKTVLLCCLAGGLRPSAGTVEVFGRPPREAQSQFVFTLQDGLAVDELSGRENAAFYTRLHPAATDRWTEVADRLALDEAALDRRVGDYSGGMTRKLELAVTLSVDVPLYVLDEPTAALDPGAVERFHAILDELAAAGRTVVATSHSPRDLRVADRLVFVGEDGLLADGSPETLRASVPPVVVVDDTRRVETPEEIVTDGRLFDTDSGRRGFLASDADRASVTAREDVVEVTDPTAADTFNYFVHLQTERDY